MSERLIPFGKINENYSLFHRLWVHREERGGGGAAAKPHPIPQSHPFVEENGKFMR